MPTTRTHQASVLGRNLRAARLNAGYPTIRSAERALFLAIGDPAPSNQVLSKWETTGMEPDNADLLLMRRVADVYNVTLETLHPRLAARWEELRAFFEQPKPRSAWNEETAGGDRCFEPWGAAA